MNRWFKFVRANRWTAFMLCSVLLLYTFLMIAGTLAKKSHGGPREKTQKSRVFSAEELKQKEAVVHEKLAARPHLMGALSLTFLAVLIGGAVLDWHWLRLVLRRKRWVRDPLPAPSVCWGLKDLFQALVFLFFAEACLFIFQMVGYWLTGLEISPDLMLLLDSLIRDLSVAFFVLLLVRHRHGRPFSDLGLRGGDFLKQVARGVVGYVAMVPVFVLSLVLLTVVMKMFSFEPEPQNVVQIYLKPSSEPYLFIFTVFVAGLGPVLEEVFFRGFAYAALRARFGVFRASIFTAAVFAAFHMNAVAFLPIFLLGYFLWHKQYARVRHIMIISGVALVVSGVYWYKATCPISWARPPASSDSDSMK